MIGKCFINWNPD